MQNLFHRLLRFIVRDDRFHDLARLMKKFLESIKKLFRKRKRKKRAAHWRVVGVEIRNKERKHMDPFKTRCNTSQEAVLKIDPPVDADGNVVVLDADAVVLEKVSGEATGTVTRNADGSYEVVLRSPGNVGDPPQPGTTTFNLKGDALPGEGVEIIEQQLVLEVVNVAAVAFGGITVAAVRTKSNV